MLLAMWNLAIRNQPKILLCFCFLLQKLALCPATTAGYTKMRREGPLHSTWFCPLMLHLADLMQIVLQSWVRYFYLKYWSCFCGALTHHQVDRWNHSLLKRNKHRSITAVWFVCFKYCQNMQEEKAGGLHSTKISMHSNTPYREVASKRVNLHWEKCLQADD